ncbi:MAG: YHS domain-containing protein [Candidatus Omnitrophica bacterium]|nr:YHS domain-containing protein [Candidatus Omnitrophota bacterium]
MRHGHSHGAGTEQQTVTEEFRIIESDEEVEALGLEKAGNRLCPVSDGEINFNDPKHKPARLAYKGKVYNFCCDMCIKDFKKDPEKFIKKIEVEKVK